MAPDPSPVVGGHAASMDAPTWDQLTLELWQACRDGAQLLEEEPRPGLYT